MRGARGAGGEGRGGEHLRMVVQVWRGERVREGRRDAFARGADAAQRELGHVAAVGDQLGGGLRAVVALLRGRKGWGERYGMKVRVERCESQCLPRATTPPHRGLSLQPTRSPLLSEAFQTLASRPAPHLACGVGARLERRRVQRRQRQVPACAVAAGERLRDAHAAAGLLAAEVALTVLRGDVGQVGEKIRLRRSVGRQRLQRREPPE